MRNDFAGDVQWDDITPPTKIYVKIDANNPEVIRLVIHELLHVIVQPMLVGRFDDTLEEVIMMSLDTVMFEYVKKSPKRVALWTALIDKKLNEDVIPLSTEERIKR